MLSLMSGVNGFMKLEILFVFKRKINFNMSGGDVGWVKQPKHDCK